MTLGILSRLDKALSVRRSRRLFSGLDQVVGNSIESEANKWAGGALISTVGKAAARIFFNDRAAFFDLFQQIVRVVFKVPQLGAACDSPFEKF